MNGNIECVTVEDLERSLASLLGATESTHPLRIQFNLHKNRFLRTLEQLPKGGGGSLLDVSGTSIFVPLYLEKFGYEQVTITSDAPNETYTLEKQLLARFGSSVRIVYLNAETDEFPFADETFDQIVCTEVLEHMVTDPMRLVGSMNRVTRTGGRLLLTSPNCASLHGVSAALRGIHPSVWSHYSTVAAQHHREYTVSELEQLLVDGGYGSVSTCTFNVIPYGRLERYIWSALAPLRWLGRLESLDRKGQFTCAVATKEAPVRQRRPTWLYAPN
jgi:SAM-dependent methyltransferase